jgi:hypothetical protein
MPVLPISARETTTFQMCARLQEIALDCGKLRSLFGLFFLSVTASENSRSARFDSFGKFLLAMEKCARFAKHIYEQANNWKLMLV